MLKSVAKEHLCDKNIQCGEILNEIRFLLVSANEVVQAVNFSVIQI